MIHRGETCDLRGEICALVIHRGDEPIYFSLMPKFDPCINALFLLPKIVPDNAKNMSCYLFNDFLLFTNVEIRVHVNLKF